MATANGGARIRAAGKRVYGFGEKKTPAPFVNACDRFIYTEVLAGAESAGAPIKKVSAKDLRGDTKLVNLLRSAVEAASDESGWAHLGGVGSTIIKQAPEFDPCNYGYKKLIDLAEATGLFKIDRRDKSIVIRGGRPGATAA